MNIPFDLFIHTLACKPYLGYLDTTITHLKGQAKFNIQARYDMLEFMDDLEAHQYLADLIREWRHHRGMSQKDLADALGLHQSGVAKIETMERRVTYPLLLQLVEALDIPWNLLRPREPDPQEKLLEALRDLISATQVAIGASIDVTQVRQMAATARQTLETVAEGDEEIIQTARNIEKKLENLESALSENHMGFDQIRVKLLEAELTGETPDESAIS